MAALLWLMTTLTIQRKSVQLSAQLGSASQSGVSLQSSSRTYTRTRDFASAFADALSQADIAMITDVYAAREAPIEGISGRTILEQQIAPAERLRSSETIATVPVHPSLRGDGRASTGRAEFLYAPTLDDVKHHLGRILQPGDVLLTMGAGNIVQIAQWFCQAGTDSRRAAD